MERARDGNEVVVGEIENKDGSRWGRKGYRATGRREGGGGGGGERGGVVEKPVEGQDGVG